MKMPGNYVNYWCTFGKGKKACRYRDNDVEEKIKWNKIATLPDFFRVVHQLF